MSETIYFYTTTYSGTFGENAVLSAVNNVNKTQSTSVGVGRVIPSDSSRYSKLTLQQEFKKYTGDLYYVVNYGITIQETWKGNGAFYEPKDLYIEVVYQ